MIKSQHFNIQHSHQPKVQASLLHDLATFLTLSSTFFLKSDTWQFQWHIQTISEKGEKNILLLLSIRMNAAQSEQRNSRPRRGLSPSSCTRAVCKCGQEDTAGAGVHLSWLSRLHWRSHSDSPADFFISNIQCPCGELVLIWLKICVSHLPVIWF